ncbi:DUF6113 family protein [Spirillospora sp. NPDC047279]|uniref:DUF6113 family protein n=1 Tax=Spirillospora sp. NPDC047279 TaxID=3155478 RepID=UPI00340BF3BC
MNKDDDAWLSLDKDAEQGRAKDAGQGSPRQQGPLPPPQGPLPPDLAHLAYGGGPVPPPASGPAGNGGPPFTLGPRAEAFIGGAAYGALGLVGAIVGLVGSFAQDWTLGSFPLVAILLVPVTFGLVRLSGWAMGTRLGALIPTLTWGVVVFLMSQRRPEGDLVIPGNLPGYVYLVGGMLAAVIAIGTVPARSGSGDWLLRGANRTPG